jgi:hypothetical protein
MSEIPPLPSHNTNLDDAAPKETTSSDPSGAIYSMYITRVQKFEDEKNVENWKGGADGILVFVRFCPVILFVFLQVLPLTFQTGLFSSTVATFIALSYPNLQQDPNVITQSLLAQISQQLSNANTNGTILVASPSVQSPFSPSTSVVFINTVWFLSLMLSLTCALMATLLQQWARRYLQIVQRKYAPLHHTRIHEYFSRGARRFGIFGFVSALSLLLLISVFLFFAGLVVFAFRGNHVVAYFTVAIVGFLTLSYIALTLMSLIFHDCPYQTPLTSVLWFLTQIIGLSFFSILHHGAKQLHQRWGAVNESSVISLRRRIKIYRKNKSKTFSENIISNLESSTEHISIDANTNLLARTLHWLHEDHELEEFVAGIPGLYESEAFSRVRTDAGGDVQRKQLDIRPVLAVLPGPTNSDTPLPWSIIRLAQRAITSKLSKPIQQKRTQACLRALYYIPGAIRDLLASYAAGKHFCLEILPLLNSSESLEIIEELWDTPNDDVALSVRCAAAAVAAFMITPPRDLLENFVSRLIGDDDAGQEFLAERFRVGDDGDRSATLAYPPRSDSARLQNIVRFLSDITNTLRYMNTQSWNSGKADSIRRERQVLYDTRRTIEFRTGRGTFEQQGDHRASAAFIPAAQQDLITLTLEILARDPVVAAGRPQRRAFRDACHQLGEVVVTQAREQVQSQVLVHPELPVPPESRSILEAWALAQAQAADVIDVVKRALDPILMNLQVQIVEIPMTPTGDVPSFQIPSQTPEPQTGSSALAAMANTKDSSPGPADVGSFLRPQLPPPLMLQTSLSPPAGLATAVGDLGLSPV